jgi:hypothetical protein
MVMTDGADEAGATNHVVEATLEELHEHLSGVALGVTSFFHVTAELTLQHVVVVAKLLLLILADAVWLRALATGTVRSRRRQCALRSVLWQVGDWNTDAS